MYHESESQPLANNATPPTEPMTVKSWPAWIDPRKTKEVDDSDAVKILANDSESKRLARSPTIGAASVVFQAAS